MSPDCGERLVLLFPTAVEETWLWGHVGSEQVEGGRRGQGQCYVAVASILGDFLDDFLGDVLGQKHPARRSHNPESHGTENWSMPVTVTLFRLLALKAGATKDYLLYDP